ncbi:sensor histidine kinase [Hyphococcus sp.]|uniref:sensor histidine kinase n=1 Tax=Hyphococcus sp. TaxID=2038636 RepID=UPI003D14C2E9
MLKELEALTQIVAREKEARKQAEQLLEEKTNELYAKTTQLEKASDSYKSVYTLLSEIMDVAPDMIITCDEKFRILSGNAMAQRHLRQNEQALKKRTIDDFLPGLSAELKRRRPGPFFIENRRAARHNGDSFPVDVRGYVGPIGEQIRYLVFFHDISQRVNAEQKRKQTESQMDEARRLEAIGALSAGISHEINTPIQFIGDNLDYLEEGLSIIWKSYNRYDALKQAAAIAGCCPEEVAQVDEFNQSVNLTALIDDIGAALKESRDGIKQVRDIIILMKEFAHPGTDDKDEVDVNAILTNVLAICKNRRKNVADVEAKLDQALPRVRCRKGQVQQVFLNLVINAIDAIDEAGKGRGLIEIETRAEGEAVQILISDTGCGVPEKLKQKIFDPFFTTKPVGKGTGQGLALAKDTIVKGHGGKLTLVDKPGYATTFLIELPLKGALQEPLLDMDNDTDTEPDDDIIAA